MLEVELKASLTGCPEEALLQRAAALGFCLQRRLRETDTYFNGDCRDFRETDEALRLRSSRLLPGGEGECLLTYKGPKVDAASSTRVEHETAVSDPEAAARLLAALGYRPAFVVDKLRSEYRLDGVTLCLDQVSGLGLYLELETLLEDAGREAAVERLLALLDALGVPRSRLTRSSYLELLAEKASHNGFC